MDLQRKIITCFFKEFKCWLLILVSHLVALISKVKFINGFDRFKITLLEDLNTQFFK